MIDARKLRDAFEATGEARGDIQVRTNKLGEIRGRRIIRIVNNRTGEVLEEEDVPSRDLEAAMNRAMDRRSIMQMELIAKKYDEY